MNSLLEWFDKKHHKSLMLFGAVALFCLGTVSFFKIFASGKLLYSINQMNLLIYLSYLQKTSFVARIGALILDKQLSFFGVLSSLESSELLAWLLFALFWNLPKRFKRIRQLMEAVVFLKLLSALSIGMLFLYLTRVQSPNAALMTIRIVSYVNTGIAGLGLVLLVFILIYSVYLTRGMNIDEKPQESYNREQV